jgi:DNA-binding CsgD family transcriptional regulator
MLKPEAKVEDLDQREFNVAYLRAKGLTYEQIGVSNRMTFQTVRSELRRVRIKIGSLNACQLRLFFEREGGWL